MLTRQVYQDKSWKTERIVNRDLEDFCESGSTLKKRKKLHGSKLGSI